MNILLKSLGIFLSINILFLLSNISDATKSKQEKCELCNQVVEEFIEGLKRTAKGNFGGGNTAWENKKLGNYLTSETRYEEISENMCKKVKSTSTFDCHQLFEEQEEFLFDWFRNKQDKIETDLVNELCIRSVKLCCPKDTFGEKCSPCPKQNKLICNGKGKCDGAGTRGGDGKCVCDSGYDGKLCDSCAEKHFVESQNETHLTCSKCHASCSLCAGPGAESCVTCNEGWLFNSQTKLCMDINECMLQMHECGEREYCQNTDGSYDCLQCDSSCLGCTGSGSDKCKECNNGYRLSGNICTDVNECDEQPNICGDNKKCANEAGSYKCIEIPSDSTLNEETSATTSEETLLKTEL